MFRTTPFMTTTILLVIPFAAMGQPLDAPSTDPEATRMNNPTSAAGQPVLRAELLDKDAKAAKHAATVQAQATNVTIVDPATTGERARAGQAHYHYQVDGGPIVASTASKLSFHALSPGPHQITVTLAGNDHEPIAKPVVLPVRVP